jgi:hypothetical protein
VNEKLWWQQSLRVIQYNLQQKDAPSLDPVRLAIQSEEMGANSITINAGGIVAWYPSKVSGHHVNEYMEGRDILREVLDACHARQIKVFARFDFLMAQDDIYQRHPQWFAKTSDGAPMIIGAERPGNWNLLYLTCPNGGYQNEDVVIPVIHEILANYDVDGFFWNGGYSVPCWCETCRERYAARYGKPMPPAMEELPPDWLPYVNTVVMSKIWNAIRRLAPDKPFVRYSTPFGTEFAGSRTAPDNMVERLKCGNMICTEAQDTLSRGRDTLPNWDTGMVYMKMAQKIKGFPAPILILHSCPGMDWRHTALPMAEFRYWSAAGIASGASLWYSLTGFPDVICDKRLLAGVAEMNHWKTIVDGVMPNACRDAKILLLCDDDGTYALGWADTLHHLHVEFDMISRYHFDGERLREYPLVVIAKNFAYPENADQILKSYVSDGGRLIVEGTSQASLDSVSPLLEVQDRIIQSEELVATYLRIEPQSTILLDKTNQTPLVPLRGRVGYCTPKKGTRIYATWVPPFSQLRFVGFPPERASLPMAQTEVPLCLVNEYGGGRVMYLSYEAGKLAKEYGLSDLYGIIDGYLDMMLEGIRRVRIQAPHQVLTSVMRDGDRFFIHLVNGIGQRPLTETIPCYCIRISIPLDKEPPSLSVRTLISKQEPEYDVQDGVLRITVNVLDRYEVVCVEP